MFERLAARIAFLHARRVYQRFRAGLTDVRASQQRALERALQVVRGGEYARRCGLASARTADDLRRAAPIVDYEALRPSIQRVMDGDTGALFSPGRRILMFATSSGTTAATKYVPVTVEFARNYRRGWNTFGLKLLGDHPDAVLRAILQSSGRAAESHAPCGAPCGAITGLMAAQQKRIVRRFYVWAPELAEIDDPDARYYALMRLGLARDVAFCITANPATLIRLAQVADAHAEALIRDVHDGAFAATIVSDAPLRRRLAARVRPLPGRAAELAAARARTGALRPRDCWRLSFLACWTGGSMGHYLQRVADWYGPTPVRDIGLLASEGRVSIPLEDNQPAGVLDVESALFEFIPLEHAESDQPPTLLADEIEPGEQYAVVLTNEAGLVRYRLNDVVRVVGRLEQAPVVEFLHRAGRVASVAGEKLTEHQVVTAFRQVCRELGVAEFDFVLAPCWSDPPFYQIRADGLHDPRFPEWLDRALGEQNAEYASRRKSRRLADLRFKPVIAGALDAMDRRLIRARGSVPEQYKRPCLLTSCGDDSELLDL